MDSQTIGSIISALASAIIGGLIGGVAVKYIELKKERFLLREKWLHAFRERIETFLNSIEKFRLHLFWGDQQKDTIERLLDVYAKSISVQLLIRPTDLPKFSKEENRSNENELNKLIVETQKQLDILWGNISNNQIIKSKVVEYQDSVLKYAIRILSYNWNRIENGLDPLDENPEGFWRRRVRDALYIWLPILISAGIVLATIFDTKKPEVNNCETSPDCPQKERFVGWPDINIDNHNENNCYGDTTIKIEKKTSGPRQSAAPPKDSTDCKEKAPLKNE